MKLEGVEVIVAAIPMRQPIGTATGSHSKREVLFLRLATDTGEGWGECAALGGETALRGLDPGVQEVEEVILREVLPSFLSEAADAVGEPPQTGWINKFSNGGPAYRMAAAALEMAVLDAELREEGVSLVRRLGISRRTVESGGLVGVPPTQGLDALMVEVQGYLERGFRRVRIKIAPGWDVVPLTAVRDRFPDLMLQADANGAYRLGPETSRGVVSTGRDFSLQDARRLSALDGLRLACIEQPLPPEDLRGHAELAALLESPIALDESLVSPHRVEQAIRMGACEVACLKPGRLGGVFATERALKLCTSAGIPAFVGGFFETGLARSFNAALAGLEGFGMPGDLSDPNDYLEDNPFTYLPVSDGLVSLLERPGVGPVPDGQSLARRTVRSQWLPFPAA